MFHPLFVVARVAVMSDGALSVGTTALINFFVGKSPFSFTDER